MIKVSLIPQLNREHNKFKPFHLNTKTFGTKFFAADRGLLESAARGISHFGIPLYFIKNP